MRFNELNLITPLLQALEAEGYTEPSPIQGQAIPPVLEGRDVLGIAQTGTGKTAAFALPILQRLSVMAAAGQEPVVAEERLTFHSASRNLSEDPGYRDRPQGRHRRGTSAGPAPNPRPAAAPAGRRAIRALVLAPTRELASQIAERFRAYGKRTGLRTAVIFGGVGAGRQVQELKAGVDVLVACPGRLLDLIGQGHVRLNQVEALVLDEADRMLDMGFIPDIRRVLKHMPQRRQTLLFSATMPPEIQSLANDLLSNPVRIEVAPVSTPAERVEHAVYFVGRSNKAALLEHLLSNQAGSLPGSGGHRVLVFTRTKRGADRVAQKLSKAGVRAEAIHGDKSQGARERALENFRRGKSPVMVATDLAARGLDVDDISHVINFDLPNEPETFVHRIGRTARAGASGIAVSFCDAEEAEYLADIEKLIRAELPKVETHLHHCTAAHASHGNFVERLAQKAGRSQGSRPQPQGSGRPQQGRARQQNSGRPQGSGNGHSGKPAASTSPAAGRPSRSSSRRPRRGNVNAA